MQLHTLNLFEGEGGARSGGPPAFSSVPVVAVWVPKAFSKTLLVQGE